jgi:uncharacterized protein
MSKVHPLRRVLFWYLWKLLIDFAGLGNYSSSHLIPMTLVRSCARFSLPLLLTLGLSSPGWAAEKLRTLSVTGRGSTAIAATLTQVRLGVEVSGKNSQVVQQEAANRAARVLTVLRQRKVEKLQTSSVTLSPTYSYENNRQTLTGYSATNTVSFRTSTTQAGVTIDEAVKAGATRVDSVNSVATDAAIDAAQSQAIQLAAKDAQRQAQSILSALGLQQKEIIGIQVNDAARPTPIAADIAQQRSAAKTVSTEIVGGEQEVQANVTLQISY